MVTEKWCNTLWVPTLITMHATVRKFEECRSNLKEKCLKLFAVCKHVLLCFLILVINPQRACSAGVTVYTWSVCLSVTTFSATLRNKQVKKQHQWVQRCIGFIFRMAIFVKVPHSEVMTWKPSEQANLLITSTGCACSVDVCGTRSHNKQRVSTPAFYLLM